jgi:carbon monoxide dehydrogenase subunit G
MPQFTASVCINRSPQDTFDFLSKPDNFRHWMPSVHSAAWTSGDEPGIGSTVTAIMKMAGKEMALRVEITRWDPPNRWDFKILNTVFPLKVMEHAHRLQPDGGGTRVTVDGEYEVVSLLRFAAGSMGKMAAKRNGDGLNAAKQLLEAG